MKILFPQMKTISVQTSNLAEVISIHANMHLKMPITWAFTCTEQTVDGPAVLCRAKENIRGRNSNNEKQCFALTAGGRVMTHDACYAFHPMALKKKAFCQNSRVTPAVLASFQYTHTV